MIRLLAIFVGFLLVSCGVGPSTRFVPVSGWDDESDAPFYEKWFGEQLRAMGERPLTIQRSGPGARRVFRILVVPNYDPAYSYRIDELLPGKAVLHWAKLDGSGGYAPGRIAKHGTRQLSDAEYRAFDRTLNDAALPTQTREKVEEREFTPEGDEVITIGIHCTHYVFELADNVGKAFVHRRCKPLEPSLASLLEEMHRLEPMEPPRTQRP